MAEAIKPIEVKTETDSFVIHGRPCEISAFSFIPQSRNLPRERTVFNSPKKVSNKLKRFP